MSVTKAMMISKTVYLRLIIDPESKLDFRNYSQQFNQSIDPFLSPI